MAAVDSSCWGLERSALEPSMASILAAAAETPARSQKGLQVLLVVI